MQRVEPLVRDDLGLKSVDEEYGHKLINEELRKEWEAPMSAKISQTHDEAFNLRMLKSTPPRRKLSHDEDEEDKNKAGSSPKKSIHLPRVTKSKRKTASTKSKDEDNEFVPIGRSKTIAHHQKTNEDSWHEELFNKDLYKIDLDQINTSISTLFLTTLKFSDELVKNMISGLGELVVNNVEELSSQTTLGSGKGTHLQTNIQQKPKK